MEDAQQDSYANEMLVLLQTENGEQIALPISALPSEAVSGEEGQVIMVEESATDQQEIILESEQEIPQVQLAPLTQLPSGLEPESMTIVSTDQIQFEHQHEEQQHEEKQHVEIHHQDIHHIDQLGTSGTNMLSNSTKTYSRKTISLTNSTLTTTTPSNSSNNNNNSNNNNSKPIEIESLALPECDAAEVTLEITAHEATDVVPLVETETPTTTTNTTTTTTTTEIESHAPISDPIVPEVAPESTANEVRTTPEAINIKDPVAQAMVASQVCTVESLDPPTKRPRRRKAEISTRPLYDEEGILEFQEVPPFVEQPERKRPRKERRSITKTKKTHIKVERVQDTEEEEQPMMTTTPDPSKSYSCKECGFSTDRINNLVIHMKETCSFAKKRWQSEVEKLKSSLNHSKN